MTKLFSSQLLYRIRNEIALSFLMDKILHYPCKNSEGYFRFLCPLCSEFNTSINPKNNLARCFRCDKNFNSIDLVMKLEGMKFVDAVSFLEDFLPENTAN